MAKRIVLPTLNDGVAGLSTKVEIKSKSKWRFIAQSPANLPSDSNIAEKLMFFFKQIRVTLG